MPDGVGVRWIFDLNFAVGPGCSNRPDDVQLVQHALNTLMVHFNLARPDGSPLGYLKRDGLFGPKTAAAISAYQKARKAAGRHIRTDGQVGPSSATGWSNDGSVQYTIVYLNRDHRDVYGTMMKEEDFPEPLKSNVKSQRMVEA
jgi:peptidoglycan hydrolase-like protein with peptidoglycan-binding domain